MKRSQKFKLVSPYQPAGSQPEAIQQLIQNLKSNVPEQILLGITGSGKTFTMANVIAEMNQPAMIIAHNKTLAGQLYLEFRELFPENAVEYFVSFYDYYQPEAYVPATDTFIEKDSAINETIDKMRHSATRSLLERNDVIIVSSVSCIYGLGSPEAYSAMLLSLTKDQNIDRDKIIEHLVLIGYNRNDYDFHRGSFRVRGDIIDIFPSYEEKNAVRIELFGSTIDQMSEIDSISGKSLRKISSASIYPTSHYVTWPETLKRSVGSIKKELAQWLPELRNQGKIIEAKRIEQRTKYDLEMLEHAGFCYGIENYSRHLTGRKPGEAPYTLFDYFPKDYLLFVDESHVTYSQIGGMYRGDRSRKETLVNHGFRLPSALDNRPLKQEEFIGRMQRTIYVSATPGDEELRRCGDKLIEQVIRPTGLLDPKIEIYPARNQVDRVVEEIHEQVKLGDRTLVSTLTKKSAEHLCEYLQSLNIKVRYMHSDTETLERSQLLKDLRAGVFDVLIGINLLREGLDLPEVSLVCILDADKEGFLRSKRALLQSCGRAARNERGRVFMFADEITDSMKACIEETERRRKIQGDYNQKHSITPMTVNRRDVKSLSDIAEEKGFIDVPFVPLDHLDADLVQLEAEKKEAVKNLDFERAAQLRDRILLLKQRVVIDT